MSAAGRLWRRAPLWRLALASGATFCALSALYPTPALLALVSRAFPGATMPRTAPPPAAIGLFPPFSTVFTGHVALAGRVLPLPRGAWHEILAGRMEAASEIDVLVLARVDGHAADALITATASVLPVRGADPPQLPYGCFDTRSLSAAPPDASGPHDCWFVAEAGDAAIGTHAASRLRDLGLSVPARLLAATWSRVDDGNGEEVTILSAADTGAHDWSRWMRRWRPALRAGWDGSTDGSSPPRDPAWHAGD